MQEIKKAAQRPLKAPITIEDGQNEITLLVQSAYLKGWNRATIEAELSSIIQRVVQGLPLYSLAFDAQKSLYAHASRVMLTLESNLNFLIIRKAVQENKGFAFSKLKNKLSSDNVAPFSVGYAETASGMPLNYWNTREYIKKRVLPVMDELSQMNALDPNDFSGRNSLRNLAEMEVRYHNHELEKVKLKEEGHRLVVSSVHADCSKRCYEWQGRVYSLDGTSGKTDDGRNYVPLEDATDILYTTKAGKTYKNGLLGFNCRHKIRPYISGVMPEKISEDEQKKQYSINLEQRKRERDVRRLKLKSALYRDIDEDAYKEAKNESLKTTQEYKTFCAKNERAFYSERLQVLKPSTDEDRKKYQKLEMRNIKEHYDKEIRGVKTPNGSVAKEISVHVVNDRMTNLDPKEYRYGTPKEFKDALTKPLKVDIIKIDTLGRKSQEYLGKYVTLKLNPDNGVITTFYRTGRKDVNKYEIKTDGASNSSSK